MKKIQKTILKHSVFIVFMLRKLRNHESVSLWWIYTGRLLLFSWFNIEHNIWV